MHAVFNVFTLFFISAQDLNFDQCNLVLNQDCDNNFNSANLCKTHRIRISAIPNYVSDFHKVPGSIKIGMKFNNNTENNHEFLHYIIENRPTSQCHIVGSSHVITFDEKKFRLFQNSWFILDQTLNHEFFRTFVKFQFCGEFVCPCAFFGMENSQWIYLNHCHQFSVMVEHSENILLSSARRNMTFFVSTV